MVVSAPLLPGDSIKITGGLYKGSTGTVVKLHAVMCSVNLIDETRINTRRVKRENVEHDPPRKIISVEDALEANKSLLSKIDEVCLILARSGIADDHPEIVPFLKGRLQRANRANGKVCPHCTGPSTS